MPEPRRLIVQLLGFAVGLALLGWCIHTAVSKGDWSRIRTADPWLVAAVVVCTVISLVANGAIFWAAIHPVRRLKFRDVQLVNAAASILNYAPIRAGLIARIMYHRQVDGIGLLDIGAWLANVGFVMVLTVGSCLAGVGIVLMMQWPLAWALLIGAAFIAIGVIVTRFVASHGLIVKHGRGLDEMLRHPGAMTAGIALRLIDTAAFTGRMAAALAILGVTLPSLGHVIVLALVAMVSNLIPFGRVGFREWAVAWSAAQLATAAGGSAGLEAVNDGTWAQLALIESAGEAIVFVPAGAAALWWYRRKWQEKSKKRKVEKAK